MKFSSKNKTNDRITFDEFYAMRKKQLNAMRNDMKKIGLLTGRGKGWKQKFTEYVNNHPTELTPVVNDYILKQFIDMRKRMSWQRVNDLMQILSDFIEEERKNKDKKPRRRKECVFMGGIPKKVVMSEEDKKLFPFGSPVDRSRYK